MTIWGLTALDLGALAFFLVAWLGFAPYLRWRGRRAQVVASAMIDHRRVWMEALLQRGVRIADTAIVGHIMSTAAFFASTTVIVIGALLGVLVNMGRGAPTSSVSWLAISPPSPLEIKVVVIVVVAVYAFQSFTWAIRQANFAAVMMGAAPPPSTIGPELHKRLATSMGNIITGVAESYDNGMRSYYFAFGAVTWLVSPVLFFLATTGVVALLLRRQTKSGTALALKEIAAARSQSALSSRQA
jgi:uncharacterized membrane protein